MTAQPATRPSPASVKVAIGPSSLRELMASAFETAACELVDYREAEALVWFDSSDPAGLDEVLRAHPNIGWIQLPMAGIEDFTELFRRESTRTWTAMQGAYADAVAEHVLALSLAGFRQLHTYSRATSWGDKAGRNLFGAHVVLIGAGGISASLVRLLEPFGCTVTAVRRSGHPMEGADRTVTVDRLDEVLAEADVVVIAAALTQQTTGMFNAERFEAMSPNAWLINVGRGGHVVTDDLVAALHNGHIGGAAIDVTDPEPLPDGHPLWTTPNCIITPHCANTPEMAFPKLRERIVDNIARFGEGAPLLGVVDTAGGY